MINNIQLKKINNEKKIGIILIITGIILISIILCFIFGNYIKRISLDSQVKASRIDENCNYNNINDTYECSFKFTYFVNEQRYVCPIEYSPNIHIDKNKDTVYYDSKKPTKCAIEYEKKIPIYIYLICAFPFILLWMGLKQLKHAAKIKI